MIKKRYNYNEEKINSILIDGYFAWISFEGSSGTCKLKKVSVHNPSIVYFDLTINVDKINKMKLDGNYIYLAVNDVESIAVRLSRSNPLGTYYYYAKPEAITENSIDIVIGDFLFVLIPGVESGENAKVLRFHKTSSTLYETIDLQLSAEIIRNARSMTIDDDGNLWICTYEDPLVLVKVSEVDYSFESWSIE